MKLCSRLLMLFCLNLCEKHHIWIAEPHFGEVMGDARPWLRACWKFHGWLFICLNWIFFAICYSSGVEAKCVQLGCCCRGSTFCTQILPGCGRPPSTIVGIRKLETLSYPMAKTASLCILSFWHNTGLWQTDGRIDTRIFHSIYSTCKASFVAHCKNAY